MKTKVVCMGDSITEGFGIGPDENYPAKLGQMLGDAYTVVNKGVCCSTAMNLMLDGEVISLPYVRQERYKEALAEKGDMVLILGKGNETYETLKDGKIYFNDIEEAKNALQEIKVH